MTPQVAIVPSLWRRYLDGNDLSADAWDPELVAETLKELCAELAIPLLDPTEDLRRSDASGTTPTYFPEDGHWTARGHAVIGRLLARFILDAGLGAGGPGAAPESAPMRHADPVRR